MEKDTGITKTLGLPLKKAQGIFMPKGFRIQPEEAQESWTKLPEGSQVFRLLSLCQPARWVARGQPNGQAGRILGRNLTQRQGCFKNLPAFHWDFIEISKFLGNMMTLVIWYFPFLWKIKANKILKKYFQVGVIVDMREKNLNANILTLPVSLQFSMNHRQELSM